MFFCLKIFEHFPHFFSSSYKCFLFHFTQENKHILLIIFVNHEKNIGQGKKKITLKLLYIILRFKIISQVTASIIFIFKGVYSRFLLRHQIIPWELQTWSIYQVLMMYNFIQMANEFC